MKGKEITIQDCWRTKDDQRLHEAIRECLRRMNYKIVEMDTCKEKSEFCGVWNLDHLTPIALDLAPDTFGKLEKQIKVYREEEKIEIMKQWCKQFNSDVVCYCNGCEKGLRIGGIEPIHMIELLAKGL